MWYDFVKVFIEPPSEPLASGNFKACDNLRKMSDGVKRAIANEPLQGGEINSWRHW